MIEHPLRQCPGCETYFRGEHWKKFCDICYKEKRGILGVTTPAAESQHPAMRADREWAEEELGYADPEVALPALAECKAMLVIEEEEVVQPSRVAHDCQHVFDINHYLPQCKCGIFEHQLWEGINELG